jgi:two-component system nitrogen regulation response regulator GlnG
MSRRPLLLERSDEAVVLTFEPERQEVLVDGHPAGSPTAISEDAMGEGVVIEIAGRVALLLHYLGMPRTAPLPSLGLVGASEAIEALRREVLRVAGADVPVLLRGESGTGKELVARAVHAESSRKGGPYLSVNMAAVPASTAASELFGHTRGAFTGAARDREGIFGRAHGGTLFLDEIGDTPADIQVMLLRVLETGEIQPVGADRWRQVDVRLIAATEGDLEAAVAEGRFRLAFFHRLAGYELCLPPLRERRDDIARLLVHFLREELESSGPGCDRLATPSDRKAPAFLPSSLVSRLVRHPWPGNVRQLRNVARLLAISGRDAEVLTIGPAEERALSGPATPVEVDEPERGARISRSSIPPSEITEDALRKALRACGYRPGLAAKKLGIGRTSIYRLMERYGSVRKAEDIPEEEILRAHDACQGNISAMAAHLEVSERALKLRLRKLKGKLGR